MTTALTPNQIREALRKAVLAAENNQLESALTLLREVNNRAPDVVAGWKWLAFYTPYPDEAVLAARRVLVLEPEDTWAQQALPVFEKRAARAKSKLPLPNLRQHVPDVAGWIIGLGMGGLAVAVLTVALLLGVASREMVVALENDTVGQIVDEMQIVTPPENNAQLVQRPPTSAAVETSTSTQYYTFEAATIEEIQNALFNAGPDRGGEHAIALTTYKMAVSWQVVQIPSSCELVEMTVMVDLNYTYPAWVQVGPDAPRLQTEWDRFMAHVIAHEEEHGRIAGECAQELAARATFIQPQTTCDELDAELNTIVADITMDCRAAQNRFDAVEGVTTFPLPPD